MSGANETPGMRPLKTPSQPRRGPGGVAEFCNPSGVGIEKGIDTGGIAALNPRLFSLTPFGVKNLTPFGVKNLTPFGVKNLTPFGVKNLTPFGVKKMPNPEVAYPTTLNIAFAAGIAFDGGWPFRTPKGNYENVASEL
jgi:hypothetical protein